MLTIIIVFFNINYKCAVGVWVWERTCQARLDCRAASGEMPPDVSTSKHPAQRKQVISTSTLKQWLPGGLVMPSAPSRCIWTIYYLKIRNQLFYSTLRYAVLYLHQPEHLGPPMFITSQIIKSKNVSWEITQILSLQLYKGGKNIKRSLQSTLKCLNQQL